MKESIATIRRGVQKVRKGSSLFAIVTDYRCRMTLGTDQTPSRSSNWRISDFPSITFSSDSDSRTQWRVHPPSRTKPRSRRIQRRFPLARFQRDGICIWPICFVRTSDGCEEIERQSRYSVHRQRQIPDTAIKWEIDAALNPGRNCRTSASSENMRNYGTSGNCRSRYIRRFSVLMDSPRIVKKFIKS